MGFHFFSEGWDSEGWDGSTGMAIAFSYSKRISGLREYLGCENNWAAIAVKLTKVSKVTSPARYQVSKAFVILPFNYCYVTKEKYHSQSTPDNVPSQQFNVGTGTLEIDGDDVGAMTTTDTFFTMISFSGLDIGLDRSSPVGDYPAPNVFTGTLRRVVVDMVADQVIDHEQAGSTQLARE